MESWGKSAGISGKLLRIAAIDARNENFSDNSNYRTGQWAGRWSLEPTEIACFESHRNIWQRIVDQKLPTSVILEDDIIVSSDFVKTISGFELAAGNIDLIRLDGCFGTHRYGPIQKINDQNFRPILQIVSSAACYLISLEGAKKLLASTQVYSVPVDDHIFKANKNWQPLQLWPAVAVQGMACQVEPAMAHPAEILVSLRTLELGEEYKRYKGPIPYRMYKEFKRLPTNISKLFGRDRRLILEGGYKGCPPLAKDLPPYKVY